MSRRSVTMPRNSWLWYLDHSASVTSAYVLGGGPPVFNTSMSVAWLAAANRATDTGSEVSTSPRPVALTACPEDSSAPAMALPMPRVPPITMASTGARGRRPH